MWDTVKPGLEEILRDNPNLTFFPEDVYSECVNERAFLFTSRKGFLVLTIEIDRYTKDKTLYMWVAYTYATGEHQWVTHQTWINDVAKNLGCKFIEAQSNVSSFEEYAVENGWSLDTRIYRRNVE
jgi:hypothetical protein|tara:strand:+ start:159 stop:533 length:375 start_codon:yes stop_codon:yes gene_type:complete